MLAYIFDRDGRFRLTEKERPVASRDTAVIRVLAASVCGTDFRTWLHGSKKIVPGTTIGHEMCGEIVEAGPDVLGFAQGDIVAVAPALGCGKCRMCRRGHTNMCDRLETLGFQHDGSFAEYMEIPARYFEMGNVNRVPENVRYEEAALAEPIACAVNAQEFLGIGEKDSVAVFGSGFIGCMHAELAFAAGAERVMMIEPNEARLRAAKELLPRISEIGGNAREEIAKLTEGCGADVAVVACSAPAAQRDAQDVIAKRGRISLFGGLPEDSAGLLDSNIIHYKELGIYGVHASTPKQNKKVLEWLSDGVLDVGKYITQRYPLENIGNAFEDIRAKGIMKAVVTFV